MELALHVNGLPHQRINEQPWRYPKSWHMVWSGSSWRNDSLQLSQNRDTSGNEEGLTQSPCSHPTMDCEVLAKGNTDLDSATSALPVSKYNNVLSLLPHPASNWVSKNSHQLEQWSCLDRSGQPHYLHASSKSKSPSQKCKEDISVYPERDTRPK